MGIFTMVRYMPEMENINLSGRLNLLTTGTKKQERILHIKSVNGKIYIDCHMNGIFEKMDMNPMAVL